MKLARNAVFINKVGKKMAVPGLQYEKLVSG
jgi:hypothetical protein